MIPPRSKDNMKSLMSAVMEVVLEVYHDAIHVSVMSNIMALIEHCPDSLKLWNCSPIIKKKASPPQQEATAPANNCCVPPYTCTSMEPFPELSSKVNVRNFSDTQPATSLLSEVVVWLFTCWRVEIFVSVHSFSHQLTKVAPLASRDVYLRTKKKPSLISSVRHQLVVNAKINHETGSIYG